MVDGVYLLSPDGRFKYCYDVYSYGKNPFTIDERLYPAPTSLHLGRTGFLSSQDIEKYLEERTVEKETWEEFERRLRGSETPKGR